MINEDTVTKIIKQIQLLEDEFRDCQGMILTEDDLKCHLFSKLCNIFPAKTRTINKDVSGTYLHSEVKFFDEDEKLTLIPDLCIIDPAHMSIFHSVEFEVRRKTAKFKRYSSKHFEIGGSAILIEIKFCRKQTGIDDIDIEMYRSDLDKIKRLNDIVTNRSQGRDKIFGIFVVFNKTNNGREKYENMKGSLADTNNLSMFYGTGNVSFEGVNPNQYDSGYLTQDVNIC